MGKTYTGVMEKGNGEQINTSKRTARKGAMTQRKNIKAWKAKYNNKT